MKDINILFLSAGRRVELIKSFKSAMEAAKIKGNIIAVDLQEDAPALFFADKMFKIRPIKEVGYIEDIIDICNRESINLIIPTIDTELEILSKNKLYIESTTNAKVMVSDERVIKIIRDKFKTYEFLKENGFKTPKVIKEEDIKNKNYSFPLFIKPLNGSSSINNFKINNEKELEFFKEYVPDPIIQEYAAGQEYCVDIFTDFNGKAITIVPKLRAAARTGEISKGKIVKDKKIIDLMKRLIDVLKPSGEINVDCIVSDDCIYIIEINGRFAGGAPMSFKAGANSPLNLLRLLMGEDLDYNEDYEDNFVVLRYDDAISINSKGNLKYN
ncbi:ATP-grasp domain-containing protein [Paraclostridium sordellii]|uniref:ATP-grasp domain-containing protein n=1 Tax=Paraclostridium sordellii TaxID=1505 RepID=UPI0005DB8DF0|nr:ATP-grasp domain-containing protein [Paeniclostridium sordellii]CEP84987.1 carbamoyl phosphate synthase-like protein [[Clostridium] sordellii] [Paeniclostridium sordellii]